MPYDQLRAQKSGKENLQQHGEGKSQVLTDGERLRDAGRNLACQPRKRGTTCSKMSPSVSDRSFGFLLFGGRMCLAYGGVGVSSSSSLVFPAKTVPQPFRNRPKLQQIPRIS